jgi:HTH-type transcriptional regulator/antitoxin MqsA
VYPRKCAECGAEVAASTADVVVEVRGAQAVVSGVEHGRCVACGEEYFALEAAARLQQEAVRRSKEARGLLPAEDIRSLRRSMGLSQVQFERLLGVGPKTVVRWEKGTVFQSATADRLMRLLRHTPQLAEVLTGGELYAASGGKTRSL